MPCSNPGRWHRGGPLADVLQARMKRALMHYGFVLTSQLASGASHSIGQGFLSLYRRNTKGNCDKEPKPFLFLPKTTIECCPMRFRTSQIFDMHRWRRASTPLVRPLGFFARARTPCGRCAQVIMRRMETTLHIGKGSNQKNHRTKHKQNQKPKNNPNKHQNQRTPTTNVGRVSTVLR